MMEQETKFTAAGRKGEEAIDVDVSSMLVGDWLTIIVSDPSDVSPAGVQTMRLVKTSEVEGHAAFTLIAGEAWTDAVAGQTAAQVGVSGQNIVKIDFRTKRDPKADLAKAERGEFTS